ncbi:MAG: hypothetical protein JNL87_10590 [Burkholderiaceae bacterium]|nr:hypothetical protein [Burkholderiaceae bacterium]
MNAAAPAQRSQVLTLVDDARAARAALAISSALAQLVQRELQVVYVENAAALAAAALPVTQVLAAASAHWAPLAPLDVEQAWRLEADRLRVLAEQASLQRAVHWSMRVMRGRLADAARTLMPQCDLLMLAGAAPQFALTEQRPPCRTVVAVDDGSPAGTQAVQLATRLAQVLGARIQRQPVRAGAAWTLSGPADLLVLPYGLQAAHDASGRPRQATLLVGAAD